MHPRNTLLLVCMDSPRSQSTCTLEKQNLTLKNANLARPPMITMLDITSPFRVYTTRSANLLHPPPSLQLSTPHPTQLPTPLPPTHPPLQPYLLSKLAPK